jgi:hypothetical protein
MFEANVTIKPDLYALTSVGGYEYHWFFEVDLNTEAPTRIIRKCENYGRYYMTGLEQQKNGVFPKVAWIVPDEKRKKTILRHIRESLREYADLFTAITFDELDTLLNNDEGAL